MGPACGPEALWEHGPPPREVGAGGEHHESRDLGFGGPGWPWCRQWRWAGEPGPEAGQRPREKPGDLKSGGRAGEKGAPPHAKASAVAPETCEWVPTSQISSSDEAPDITALSPGQQQQQTCPLSRHDATEMAQSGFLRTVSAPPDCTSLGSRLGQHLPLPASLGVTVAPPPPTLFGEGTMVIRRSAHPAPWPGPASPG